ncbi:MAG: hypothetical protein ACFE0R_16650 [Salinarimonas sp.]
MPNVKTCEIAFMRSFAAAGVSAFRSRRMRTASKVMYCSGMSAKSTFAPLFVGSSIVDSRMARRTRRVLAARARNSGDMK